MKKSVLLIVAVLLVSVSTVFAQQGPPGDRQKAMEERRNAMYVELGLNNEQKEKMNVLNDESRTLIMDVRNDNSLSEDQKMEKLKGIRENQNKKREAILTLEQNEKYNKMMKDRQANGRGVWSQGTPKQ